MTISTIHRIFSIKAVTAGTFALLLAASAASVQASGSHSGGHGKSKGHGHGASQGGGGHGHGMSAAAGEPGKAADASRTVEIKMFDNYYEPESVSVKAGETVRFIIKNEGQLVHEFNIGTAAMHATHQKEMMMMVEHGALHPDRIDHHRMKMDMGGGKTMEHNDPNSVLLEPGKQDEVIWKFAKAGALEFACNVPGHYAAGMVGKFRSN